MAVAFCWLFVTVVLVVIVNAIVVVVFVAFVVFAAAVVAGGVAVLTIFVFAPVVVYVTLASEGERPTILGLYFGAL